MSETDKGFNFKRLFFRDTTAPAQQEQKVQTPEPVIQKSQDNYFQGTETFISSGTADNSLVEDFVQRLQNLINQNNQPGFDFLEFTESLFEEKQNPDPEVYKTVFRIAQKFEKSLTSSKLLESASFYKNLVQRAADSEIEKGELKKKGLLAEKESEKNSLDNSMKETRTKIQLLTQQIHELQNQEVLAMNQLAAIDQKYNSQFIDIERKISAIQNSKEQVVSSIVDIETGIKSNL